jgi:hypothetical protein
MNLERVAVGKFFKRIPKLLHLLFGSLGAVDSINDTTCAQMTSFAAQYCQRLKKLTIQCERCHDNEQLRLSEALAKLLSKCTLLSHLHVFTFIPLSEWRFEVLGSCDHVESLAMWCQWEGNAFDSFLALFKSLRALDLCDAPNAISLLSILRRNTLLECLSVRNERLDLAQLLNGIMAMKLRLDQLSLVGCQFHRKPALEALDNYLQFSSETSVLI